MNQISQKTMTMFADTFNEGVRLGKFEAGHPMMHADIMWAIFAGSVLWEEAKRNMNPRKNFLKYTLDKAFEILSQGIKKLN